jgi:hypothetical protein
MIFFSSSTQKVKHELRLKIFFQMNHNQLIKRKRSQDNDYDHRNRPKLSRILSFTAVYGV